MAQRSTRHAQVVTLSGSIPNGVDYSSSPTSIPEGFALDMLNLYYPDQGTAPATRPGTAIVHWDGTGTDDKIDALYVWEKNAATSYLIVAKGAVLYYLDTDGVLQTIGELRSGVVPCFANYNQKLIIADQSSNGLRTWDGTDYEILSGSPTKPSVCLVHATRLWCNSMTDGNTDIVYASKAGDETEWESDDGAEAIVTAYGSGVWVSALASFGSDLIVFKQGKSGARQIFRISTAGSSENWSGELLSSRSTALGHGAVATLGSTDVMFADKDGVKMLSGTDRYGDFAVASDVGMRIKSNLIGDPHTIAPISPWGGVLMLVTGSQTAYFFHPHNSAWCPMKWEFGTVTAACSSSTEVYLGDNHGRIWRAASVATDGVIVASDDPDDAGGYVVAADPYDSYVHTPLQADSYGVILRRLDVLLKIISAGPGTFYIVDADLVTFTQIASWDTEDMDALIYGDVGLIYGDNALIFSTTELHVRSRSRYRSKSLSFKIKATSGRFQVNQIQYEVARVNA